MIELQLHVVAPLPVTAGKERASEFSLCRSMKWLSHIARSCGLTAGGFADDNEGVSFVDLRDTS